MDEAHQSAETVELPAAQSLSSHESLATHDKRDSMVAKEFVHYDTLEYIHQIYPHLDLEQLTDVITEVRRLLDSKETDDVINVGELAKRFGFESEPIVVENIAYLEFNARVGSHLVAKYPRDHLKALEIDGGGVMIGHAVPSLVAKSIVRFEYLKGGVTEAMKWLERLPDAKNWDSYFRYVRDRLMNDNEFLQVLAAQRQSSDSQVSEHANRLAAALEGDLENFTNWVREVVGKNAEGKTTLLRGDIFQENFGLPEHKLREMFDITTIGQKVSVDITVSNYTSESATKSKRAWKRAMKHLMSTVKPGGQLMLTACLGAKHYKVGERKFPAVPITEADVLTLAAQHGFSVEVRTISTNGDGGKNGYTSLGAWCFNKAGTGDPESNNAESPQPSTGDHAAEHAERHMKWRDDEYHKIVYREFDPVKARPALEHLRQLTADQRRSIDIDALVEQFDIQDRATAENFCLLDFDRRVGKRLLSLWPDGNRSYLSIDNGGVMHELAGASLFANHSVICEYLPQGATASLRWRDKATMAHN